MAATMKSYRGDPGAVIGHSLGEVAAAVVSGALSLEDGVKVICRRSLLCLKIAGGGAMAAVELPAQKVREELERRGVEDVVVAVVASPKSTVIGGSTETVRQIVAEWEQQEIMAREVAVDVASHTPQVEPILDELAEMLDDITRWHRSFRTTPRRCSTRVSSPIAMSITGSTTCGTPSASPRPCRPPSRTASGLRRAVAAPATDPAGRPDRCDP